MVKNKNKLIYDQDLLKLRSKYRKKKIVLAHGVFDVFHVGHLRHLKFCKNNGDILVVSLTADNYVNKGPGRPHFNINYRAELISAISDVDYVYINNHITALEVIKKLKPNFYVKGEDYQDFKKDITSNIIKEKKEIEKNNGKLIFSKDITFSSSKIINQNFETEHQKKLKSKVSWSNIGKIFKKIKKLNVLVIGELIIDEYIFTEYLGAASKEEITVMNFKNKKLYLGGAFPVVKNISEFCKKVTFLSCGKINNQLLKSLKDQSKQSNVNLNYFEDELSLIKKTRFLSQKNKKLFEIYHQSSTIKNHNNKKIISFLNNQLSKFDLVIVADFGHGLLNKEIINLLNKKAKFLSINTQTNAENRGFNVITKYRSSNAVTLDLPELQLAIQQKLDINKSILKLYKLFKTKFFTLTLASKGLIVSTKEKNRVNSFHVNAFSDSAIDTLGAGDAVFAFTSLMSRVGAKLEENAFVSNLAGALKIKILGHESHIKKTNLMKSLQYLLK